MGVMDVGTGSGLSRRDVLKAGGTLAAATALSTVPALQARAEGANQVFLDGLVRNDDGGTFLRVIATARQGAQDSGNVATGKANTARLGGIGWGEIKVDVIKGPNGEPDWMQNKFTVDSATTEGGVLTMEGHVYRARNPQNGGKTLKIVVTPGPNDVAPIEFFFDAQRYTGFGALFQSGR